MKESINIEPKRRKYIPYNCRCEAIGDCRDNGRRYRSLEGKWSAFSECGNYTYSRKFRLTREWKGRRLYLILENCAEKNTVYINGTLACEFEGGKALVNGFAESEITQFIDIDGENEIKIVAGGIGADIRAFVSIFARKFVHMRDFCISFVENSVKAEVFMSQNVPAEITLEAYNDDLELIGSVVEKISGTGKLQLSDVGDEDDIRIVLLVCGDEVIPYCAPEKSRPALPKGELPAQNSKADYALCKCSCDASTSGGKIVIKYIGNDKNGQSFCEKFSYSINTENDIYASGEFVAEFKNIDGEYIAECNIEYNSPSLSFYEFFLNIEKDGEFIGQLGLPVRQTASEKIYSSDMKPLAVCQSDKNIITAQGLNFDIQFDLSNGTLCRMAKEGCDVISGEMSFSFDGEAERAKHKSSKILSRDENCVVVSSVYTVKNDFDFSVLWIIFGDGEVSVSVSGFYMGDDKNVPNIMLNVPIAKECEKCKVYGAANSKASVYDGNASNGCLNFNNVRWMYSYGNRTAGLLVKTLQPVDMQICDRASAFLNIDENGMLAASFVLKAVFCENEDIVREARTIPAVK